MRKAKATEAKGAATGTLGHAKPSIGLANMRCTSLAVDHIVTACNRSL
jgi:hypothetical protein